MATLTAYANANYTHPDATSGAWTNPTYAYADDGSYATRAGTTKNTWYGNLFGFDLSTLPDNATVSAISLEAQWKNSANDSSGPVLGLAAYSGGAISGTEATDTTGTTSDETLTKAPTGISVSALKTTGANGFAAGVRFRRTDNTAHTASLDYVKCTITYTIELSGTATMGGVSGGTGFGKKAGAGVGVASAIGAVVVVGAIALFGAGTASASGGVTASGSMGAQGTSTTSCISASEATGEQAAPTEEHSGTATLEGPLSVTGVGAKKIQETTSAELKSAASGSGNKVGSANITIGLETGTTATGGAGRGAVAVIVSSGGASGSSRKDAYGTAGITSVVSTIGGGNLVGGPAIIIGYGITSAQGFATGLLERNRNGISMSMGIGMN